MLFIPDLRVNADCPIWRVVRDAVGVPNRFSDLYIRLNAVEAVATTETFFRRNSPVSDIPQRHRPQADPPINAMLDLYVSAEHSTPIT